MRNPTDKELRKWINKLIQSRLKIHHDKENRRFELDINGEIAKVDYQLRKDKMYLVHSEVPHHLRNQGIGKVLVEKTFEKLVDEGYKTVAICSFIKRVAEQNEKWKKIID